MSIRRLHRWFGVSVAGVGLALALTGGLLSLEPVNEAIRTGSLTTVADISVAELADAVTQQISGVERIEKTANNTIWVHYGDLDGFGKVAFDPAASSLIQAGSHSPIWTFVKDFHRTLFLGNFGRGVVGMSALAMLILTVSGLTILARRMGGWRALITPPKSGKVQSMHLDFGRIAAVGLLVVGLTGGWMSLATFELVPSETSADPAFPVVDATQPALPIAELGALKQVPLADLRELVLPYPNDPTDAYLLTTQAGTGYVDPTTGQMVGFAAHGMASQAFEFIYLLHTGQGAWMVGILLGLSMLAVPVVILSGGTMALRRPRVGKRQIKSVPPQKADIIVLVGSEGATTWGFAAEFCCKLTLAGKHVHVGDLNDVGAAYPSASHLFILTATYGQGEAPSNATKFLDRLPDLKAGHLTYTVLGFGDRSFPHFCKFAKDVDATCAEHGLTPLTDLTTIDRQSSQSFQAWGHTVGGALGITLDLHHMQTEPRTTQVQLHSRVDYGQEVQAPVSIIRLSALKGKLPPHSPGDLLGVRAPDTAVPRFYSLASTHKDGVIEICVRRQSGGACSGFLTRMTKGDVVDVFIKPNPAFRPSVSKAPLILIGAGAGIGPLIGFARANHPKRAASLFWGGRDPNSDFLYQDELSALKKSGNLSLLSTAFSRCVDGVYVQEKLRTSANELRLNIQLGGQVMVCGGAAMGAEVRGVWDEILAPIGLSVHQLISEKRYLEDVY